MSYWARCWVPVGEVSEVLGDAPVEGGAAEDGLHHPGEAGALVVAEPPEHALGVPAVSGLVSDGPVGGRVLVLQHHPLRHPAVQ